jgi:hypothetical protein
VCCAGNPADQGMFNLCSFISIPDVDNAFASILVRCAIPIFVRQNPVLLVVIPLECRSTRLVIYPRVVPWLVLTHSFAPNIARLSSLNLPF